MEKPKSEVKPRRSLGGSPRKSRVNKGVGTQAGDRTSAKEGVEREEEAVTKEAHPALTVAKFLELAITDRESGIYVGTQVYETARQNDKRAGFIAFVVPDDMVKNLTGYDELRDFYFVVRVPREFYEKHAAKV